MVDVDDPTAEPAASVRKVATRPVLRVVFSGGHIVAVDHPLDNARTDAGRGVAGPLDLRLDKDARVSRQHATFVVADGAVQLENRSSHGTWVNGARVDAGSPLADGDVVRLGDSFLVLRFMPDNGRDVASSTLLGRSPAIMQLRSLIDIVGPTLASVVLLGETGAGKEVAARALHERSRRTGAFVAVNCAAIPENLAESQLFGHRAGAFTGAHKDHAGLFREAHNGTLFLDEVGELPLLLQPKLLRVLDEKNVYAVGSTSGVPIDVRMVAATNREIARDVKSGAFRGDLFARLTDITISLPPLRARREDVLLLLQSALAGVHDGSMALSPDLVASLLNHDWAFNVRELKKIAMELEVKAQGRRLLDVDLLEGRILGPRAADLDAPAAQLPASAAAGDAARVVAHVAAGRGSGDDVPAPTRAELVDLVARHHGRVSDVARATGRSRTQVYRWLAQHGIDVAQYRT